MSTSSDPQLPPAEIPAGKIYSFPLRRPVTTAMLFLTLIVFGWRSYQQLPINLMPDISYPTLTVRTEYEGAAPEDVEKLVTRPLEEMLSIVSGVVEISSISRPGLSEIVLEFTWGTEMNVAQQDVRDRLDLFDPPKEVTEKPVILRFDPTLDPVMRVALRPGDRPGGAPLSREEEQQALTELRDAAERHVKSDLEAEPGIAQVAVKGGQEEEIQILVDAERLKSLGLSLDVVVNGLAQQNINLSGGRLKEGKTEYLVRTLNEFTSIEEVANSIITTPGGQQLPLSALAKVFMGSRDREAIVRIDGHEAVELEIFKEGDANTVAVCNRTKDLLGFTRELGFAERLQERIAERMAMGETPEGETPATKAKQTLMDRLPARSIPLIMSDQSRFIEASIAEVRGATITGGLLALIVLFFFLRELKPTVIIGVAIPISVIVAFVPMFARDISLNIMSLGGLALGVGMLVDNSIVVLESIFRCKEEGDDDRDAAERGTNEVWGAVIASTMTTVCVFFPMAFVEGVSGQLFGDLAMTVTFSLLASLLTALLLVPLFYARKPAQNTETQEVVWALRAYNEARSTRNASVAGAVFAILPLGIRYAGEYLAESARDTFGPSLASLRSAGKAPLFFTSIRAAAALVFLPLLLVLYVCQVLLRIVALILTTLLLFVSMLLIGVFTALAFVCRIVFWLPLKLFDVSFHAIRGAYGTLLTHALRFSPILLILVTLLTAHAIWLGRNLGTELIPPMNQGEFGIRMEAPAGTRLEETQNRAMRIEALVRQMPEVASVAVEVGQESSRGENDRGENVAEFSINLKNPKETALIQDALIDQLRTSLGGFNEEITFTLPSLFSFKTPVEIQIVGDDLRELRRIGELALAAVATVEGVADPELSVKQGYPEIVIELDRELLATKGVAPGIVAQRLRTEVQGEIATRFNRSGEKVDIRVRTDKDFLQDREDLYQLSISDGPVPIPLRDVAHIRVQDGPSEIRRVDQRQVVLITTNVEGRDLGAVSTDIQAALATVDMPRDFYFLMGGQNRELETSYQSLYFALALAIFLVYVVMACQFESIWQPAIVMFSVPLAFVGVLYALVYTGTDLSIMVFLGGIVLAGIVVNNAIVLVDYVNQLRERGLPKRDALVTAGTVRLRPIFMTTITTVLGLLPMAIGAGEGSELRKPLAITVMAGLASSTILTLIVIPAIYEIFGGRDKPKTSTETP
jgi:HAE1 family hydrophobic/amphiphilic exporter-1